MTTQTATGSAPLALENPSISGEVRYRLYLTRTMPLAARCRLNGGASRQRPCRARIAPVCPESRTASSPKKSPYRAIVARCCTAAEIARG